MLMSKPDSIYRINTTGSKILYKKVYGNGT